MSCCKFEYLKFWRSIQNSKVDYTISIWRKVNESSFIFNFQNSLCILLNIATLAGVTGVPYTIITIYYMKISNYLKHHEHTFSAASKRGQTDLNRVLLAQAIIPVFFSGLPASIHIMCSTLDFNLTLASVLGGILYSWIPIGNAISILCFITAYRRKLKQIFTRAKPLLFRSTPISATITFES